MDIQSGETFRCKGTADLRNAEAIKLPDGGLERRSLEQEELVEFPLRLTEAKVHDDVDTVLPETALGTDDLAMIEGTFGTDGVTIQSADGKAKTVTQRCRWPEVRLPESYDAAQTLRIRVRAGMITTISDGTATVDIECHKQDKDGAVGADLCATAAQSMNSLTKADIDFTITATGLQAGDVLDIRATIAITDTATGTAVIGEISRVSLACDIKG